MRVLLWLVGVRVKYQPAFIVVSQSLPLFIRHISLNTDPGVAFNLFDSVQFLTKNDNSPTKSRIQSIFDSGVMRYAVNLMISDVPLYGTQAIDLVSHSFGR